MNERLIDQLERRIVYLEAQMSIHNSVSNSLINRELDRIIASGDAEKVKKYVT
jgi:hypothetical protein